MIRSRLLRLTLTILLSIPAMGGSSLAYVCQMDGQVHRQCCCDHVAPAKSDCAKLSKRGCCDVRSTGSEPVSKSTKTDVRQQTGLAASTFPLDAARVVKSYQPAQRPQLVANGPPLFLRNCSLLR